MQPSLATRTKNAGMANAMPAFFFLDKDMSLQQKCPSKRLLFVQSILHL